MTMIDHMNTNTTQPRKVEYERISYDNMQISYESIRVESN